MTEKQSGGTAVVVYGASSENIKQIYKDEVFEVGRLIAGHGHAVVCGGGRQGLMRAAIDGALSVGGEAIGVLPQFMVANAWQHPQLSRMIEVPDMHVRKQTMAGMSMAAIACPGGCGTFEELTELITWRQLGLYHGNIVILNIEGYYDSLIAQFDRAIAEGFMHEDHRSLFCVATTADEAVRLALGPVEPIRFSQKIH